MNTATELAVLDDEAAAVVEGYRLRVAAVFRAVLTKAMEDGDLGSSPAGGRGRSLAGRCRCQGGG